MIRDSRHDDGINVLVIINLKLDNDIEMTFYVIELLILIESQAHLRII
jgi:hypothetical protein